MDDESDTEKSEMLAVAEAEMTRNMKRDTLCGIGNCKTKKCAKMPLFTLNLSCVLLFHISLFSYAIGTMRTIEKRFGLSSTELGQIGAMNQLVQIIAVLLAGYFGRKTHKPRYISISILSTTIGAYLAASPYFMYGPKGYDPALIASFSRAQAGSNQLIGPELELDYINLSNQSYGVPYSVNRFANNNSSLQVCDSERDLSQCSASSQKERDFDKKGYYIFVLANLFFGIGISGVGTLGLSYIDENVKKDDSAIYIAAVTSMFALSPIIGFSLAAVTTRLSEDMSDTPIPPEHPQFIGCWWLGFVIIGTLILLSAIPMFFFPKHMQEYYIVYKKPRIEAAVKDGSLRVGKKNSAFSVIVTHLKGFPVAIWKLLSDPAYMCLSLCKVASLYLVVGLIINMPRYMEIHFGQPAYIANIVSAIAGAIGGAGGNIVGGIIMKKLHLQPRGSVRMLIMALLVTIVGLIVFILVSCPQVPFAGQNDPHSHQIDVILPCSANCSCSRDKYQPMCSSEGVMYFSPCHAGCTESSYINGTYSNCACLSDGESLAPGACVNSCNSGFYIYVVTFFLLSFISSMAGTPTYILTFRIVPEDLKAFSLSINTLMFNLLVFLPGPLIFGLMFDKSCLIWGQNCNTRGACFFYDIKDYRYYMHGLTLVCKFIALFFAGLTAYFVHKRFSKDGELCEGDEKKKIPLV